MLSGLIQQCYNVADTYIVGQYISANALAAVGAVGPMSSLLMGLAMGVTGGFAIPIAQAFGAGDRKKTNHYAGNAISLTIIISLTIMSLSLFSTSSSNDNSKYLIALLLRSLASFVFLASSVS